MVQRGDGDARDVASPARQLHREHVASRSPEFPPELLAAGGGDDRRTIGGEFDQRLREDDRERDRPVTDHRGFAGRRPDGREGVEGDDHVAEPSLADDDEVRGEGDDRSLSRPSASTPDGDGSSPLGQIEEHAGDRGVLGRLLFEPSGPGPLGGRLVDPTLCDPRREPGQRVVGGQPDGLGWGWGVHEARGYRYHSG